MKIYAMTIIFEDATVDLCRIIRKNLEWVDVIPLEGNIVVVDNFKIVCSSNDQLCEEMRHIYPHIEYITVKLWQDEIKINYC